MPTLTIQFIKKKFEKDNQHFLDFSNSVHERLLAVWLTHADLAYTDRYKKLLEAADHEISAIKQKTDKPIPCQAGCNHCCTSQLVMITTTEAQLLIQYIEEKMSPSQKETAIKSILTSERTNTSSNAPCAFLTTAGCSVYENRPTICRSYYSTSESACSDYKKTRALPPALAATQIIGLAVLDVSDSKNYHVQQYEINELMKNIYTEISNDSSSK